MSKEEGRTLYVDNDRVEMTHIGNGWIEWASRDIFHVDKVVLIRRPEGYSGGTVIEFENGGKIYNMNCRATQRQILTYLQQVSEDINECEAYTEMTLFRGELPRASAATDREAAEQFASTYPGAMGRGALHDAFIAGAKYGREQEREACAEIAARRYGELMAFAMEEPAEGLLMEDRALVAAQVEDAIRARGDQ